MPPIVNDRVAWSVGLSVGLSPSEPCRKFGSDRDTVCVQHSGAPRKRLITYSKPLRASTVLCLFDTIQPSSCMRVHVSSWCSESLSNVIRGDEMLSGFPALHLQRIQSQRNLQDFQQRALHVFRLWVRRHFLTATLISFSPPAVEKFVP